MAESRVFRCANCHHPNAILLEPAKPGAWDTWGKVATILIATASLLIAGVVALAPTETTDIGKARAFLGSYFGNAPYQPDITWRRLSDSYKENGALAADKLTYESYEKYFQQFELMTVTDVTNYEGRSGEWYSADLYRLNKNGDAATTRFAYQLECPWQSKLPIISCSPSNIQIVNVCVVQTSGQCREDETLGGSSAE